MDVFRKKHIFAFCANYNRNFITVDNNLSEIGPY